MALNYNDVYLSRLSELNNSDDRQVEFCKMLLKWSDSEENEVIDRVMIALMNLFPDVNEKIYFFRWALEIRRLKMVKLIEASGLAIHEVPCLNGRSGIHYLAEVIYEKNYGGLHPKAEYLKLIEYFLENPRENFCDDYGYTYFHAACMSGNVAAVNLLLSQGVDVNLDSFKYSALHIAAQYRHEEIVEILLRHGANPNQPDHELSMPLHALARLCLCRCSNMVTYCDKRKPVDKIVQMLVDQGADIEAQNRHRDRPLDLAVSRFDVQLVKSLLKHGASLDNLNEDKMFSAKFTSTELKNYPLTLNIIEMVQLLQSVGFKMSFETRLKMLKCWIKVRGNDTDHLIGDKPGYRRDEVNVTIGLNIVTTLTAHSRVGFYMKQEARDFLRFHSDRLRAKVPSRLRDLNDQFVVTENVLDEIRMDVSKIKNIMLTDDVSLYRICQMNYDEGCSILKNANISQLPPMDDLSCTWLNVVAKRHLANLFIRPQLELFAADLFMTDYCLNLSYVPCRLVAEKMSYEDLLDLYKRTDEKICPRQKDSWETFLRKFFRLLYKSIMGYPPET